MGWRELAAARAGIEPAGALHARAGVRPAARTDGPVRRGAAERPVVRGHLGVGRNELAPPHTGTESTCARHPRARVRRLAGPDGVVSAAASPTPGSGTARTGRRACRRRVRRRGRAADWPTT